MQQSPQRARRSPLLLWLGVAAIVLGATLAAITISGHHGGPAETAKGVGEYTAAVSNLRDGWDSHEPDLSPSMVAGGRFGRLFSTEISGQVYAQPLVIGNTVVVATEDDWVYGIDAISGKINWGRQIGAPWPSKSEHCADVAPNVGITSTPVYDPAAKRIYLVAETVPQGSTASDPEFSLVAMNPETGAVTRQIPIGGTPGNGGPVFHPFDQLQRAGLLLMNGSVYAAFAGHCDYAPYVGYVAGIKVSTGSVRLWSAETALTGSEAGIWAAGSGLMSDGSGHIFLATGNGNIPPRAAGAASPAPGALGNAVVRLGAGSDGTLSAKDFFSPADAGKLNIDDTDLGASGPIGLPFGTRAYPKLLAQAGKEGTLYLLDRDSLGGRLQGPEGTDKVAAEKSVSGEFGNEGQYGRAAAFAATMSIPDSTSKSNDYRYYVGNQYVSPAYNGPMRFIRVGASASGKPTVSDVAYTSVKYGYLAAGSPVVTSSGRNLSSALVWLVGMDKPSGRNGTLYAFRAVPSQSCTQARQCEVTPVKSLPLGTASKFSVPATSGGRVYVGTRDGHLLAFGDMGASAARVTTGFYASPGSVNFGKVPVGVKAEATVLVYNGGPSAETVSFLHSPGKPFTVKGWPADGTTVGAGRLSP